MSLTYTDIFCGAGGSSIGLTEAGLQLKLAANHWDRAIETHSTNFPDAEHLLADVSNYDMRRLPSTDVGWFSPECTWHSPAGGRKRLRAQLDLLDDYVPTDGGIRSRATMLDVIRATEVHRYKIVIVENVVEAASWPLFDWWLSGMVELGYSPQIVCVSAAHIGSDTNAHAPQWRDRMYVVFNRDGVPQPDVRPRPLAWCEQCALIVAAVQSWKRPGGRKVGKYGPQYLYRCPRRECRHAVVEPFVAPAASAIDWSDIGHRIGDRPKPLAEATMRRIRTGLAMFAQPTLVANHGNTWEAPGSSYVRAWPAYDSPLFARTSTPGDGLACPPFVMVNRTNNRPRGVDEPLAPVTTGGTHGLTVPFITELRGGRSAARSTEDPLGTVTAGGNHHYLTVPGAFIQKHHGGVDYQRIEHMTKDVRDALPAVVARANLSLVIPYRRGRGKATTEPLATAVDAEDCHFRMLKPREHLRAQRFPDSYVVKGNKGEQTMQAGNAVPSNVAHWLGTAVIEALS
jgi:DNA (cytosine-5)-methyltransferase 1